MKGPSELNGSEPPATTAKSSDLETSSKPFTTDADNEAAENLRRKLVGVWKLTLYRVDLIGDVNTTQWPMGEQATGLIIYTASGHMSVQIMRPGARKFESPIPHVASAEELKEAAEHYMAYGGRYEIFRLGDGRLAIRHVVEHSLCPNWIGQDQIRVPILRDEKLTLQPHSMPILQSMKAEVSVEWERVA